MPTTFLKTRVLMNCANDLGGSASEDWFLQTDTIGVGHTRSRQLCDARAQLSGTAARIVGYEMSKIEFDGVQTFRLLQKNSGGGVGAPGNVLNPARFPPLGTMNNSIEYSGCVRTVGVDGHYLYSDDKVSDVTLAFGWLILTRDVPTNAWADLHAAITAWQSACGAYKQALLGNGSGSVPFGRFYTLPFGVILQQNWADMVLSGFSGDGTNPGGVIIFGDATAKYQPNTKVEVRRRGARGRGSREREFTGKFIVHHSQYVTGSGHTLVSLACTRHFEFDFCKSPGYIYPVKYGYHTVKDFASNGHGRTKRSTKKSLSRINFAQARPVFPSLV